MREKITTRTVETAKSAAKKTGKSIYVWDTQLKGFGVYISPKGDVSWLIQKWIGGRGGRSIRYVIDHNPPMTLEAARNQAEIDIGELRKGVDIVERRRQQRGAIKTEINGAQLGSAFERYLRRQSTGNRYWQEVERMFRAEVIGVLGERTLVSKISKAQLRQLIEAKEDEGLQGSARNLFSALRPFFKWCAEKDLIDKSPMADLTAPKPTAARDRSLSKVEVKSLWIASGELGYPFGPFYKLLLLTGQRREEVAGLLWSEIDLTNRTWTIPGSRTKNKREHIVHLSDLAMAVLAEIPKANGQFVFSTTQDSSISGYSKAKLKLDALMSRDMATNLKPWRTHDLRRTITSTLAELGIPTDVADRLLNHVQGSSRDGVKGIYQRYEFLEERRQAMEAWGSHVGGLVLASNVGAQAFSFSAV